MNPSLESEFLGSLFRLKSILGAEFGKDGIREKKKISIPEYIFLRKIAGNEIGADDNTRLADVREYLAVSKSAISQMLAALEKNGYICRTTDPENRRNVIVTLTPSGKECLHEINAIYEDRFSHVMQGMGEGNMKEMIRLIHLMNDVLSNRNEKENSI